MRRRADQPLERRARSAGQRVTPPYILAGVLSVQTEPSSITLLVDDPRNAQTFAVGSGPSPRP